MFARWRRNRNRKKLRDEQFDFLFGESEAGEYVVFDTETTGLDPKKDEILSIGAVLIRGNRIVTSETFECFVRPSGRIDAKSITIHRIRPCDLQSAIDPHEAMEAFLRFIGPRPLVGYYLEFDVAMIERYVKPWLGIKLPNRQIEVSGLYFDYKTELIPQGNIDLRFDKIIKDLNIPNMGQHNAVNDAIMTAMVFLKLQTKSRRTQ
ncbi:MAG: 3'-5' exonuclease [Campylobacterales bacterium]|nr:3'-5' exonuclease [Campylobacterales bacterium]